MARKNSQSSTGDIAEIQHEIGQLMHDLETRVGKLNELARNGAAHAAGEAGEYVTETLSETAERLRASASEAASRLQNGAQTMTDEASRMSHDAMRRIEDEVGQRPLLTLAIAAGIGFIAGMASRRH